MASDEYVYLSPYQIEFVKYERASVEAPRDFSAIQRDMYDYIPPYYRSSVIAGNILDREATELAGLNADIADVLAQFFIDTATWGLANWERICGISIDETKPITQRRSAVKGRLRGVGTVTVALIKNVAESFGNGTVNVTEDSATYTITIRYISTYGIPDNLADIQAALRDIIPAHLAISFVFTYMTWNALNAKALTWDTLTTSNYTWTQFEKLT